MIPLSNCFPLTNTCIVCSNIKSLNPIKNRILSTPQSHQSPSVTHHHHSATHKVVFFVFSKRRAGRRQSAANRRTSSLRTFLAEIIASQAGQGSTGPRVTCTAARRNRVSRSHTSETGGWRELRRMSVTSRHRAKNKSSQTAAFAKKSERKRAAAAWASAGKGAISTHRANRVGRRDRPQADTREVIDCGRTRMERYPNYAQGFFLIKELFEQGF